MPTPNITVFPSGSAPRGEEQRGRNLPLQRGLHLEGLQPGLDVLGNALGNAQLSPGVKKGLPGRWGRHRSLFSHFSMLL